MVKNSAHYTPKTLENALLALEEEPYTIMAGGTDLMVKHRSWSDLPPDFNQSILFISQLKALNYIRKEGAYLHIGATVTLQRLLEDKSTPKLLNEAVGVMASYAIRHTATLAGNIGNASPAGDSLPVLYVLNAEVVLLSKAGRRKLPIESFIQGPGKTALKSNELIEEVIIECVEESDFYYRKVGGRKADAISKVCFAGLKILRANTHGHTTFETRMAFGAVGPTIIRSKALEADYNSGLIDNEQLILGYEALIKPIDDQRSNALYRKQIAMNLMVDFLKNEPKE